MKIPINLASQPFRRDRAMLVASTSVCLALVATLGGLIWLGLNDRSQLADVRREVSRLNGALRQVTSEQAKLDAVLRRPDNAQVLERSVFLNSLLRRKGISWTRIFADLEATVPYNVRIIQIRPSVDSRDNVSLDMQFGSDSPLPAIELLRKMGESRVFSHPEIKNQQPPTQGEPLWRYRVSVDYAQKL